MMDKVGTWLNEPPQWRTDSDGLHVVTGPGGAFWQTTHYGFVHDSGHLLQVPVLASFTAQVFVEAELAAVYDQAGLMLRAYPESWCKAGLELPDGEVMISSVVTLPPWGWATGRLPEASAGVWLRMTLKAGVLRVQYSQDGERWPLFRLAPFSATEGLFVGPMCCSPQRKGLRVLFRHFSVGSAPDKPLHDVR